jgi:hypothetical protein
MARMENPEHRSKLSQKAALFNGIRPSNHVLALKDFALRSSVAAGYGIDSA